MHTEDLRAFFAIVDKGSLTAAARALGVPKSTIGRRLSRLEEDLDAQLVIRTPRRTQITDLGLRLHRGGEPVLAILDELRRDLRDEGTEPKGQLRISAPEDLATAYMGRLCGRFLLRYPRVDLQLVGSNLSVELLADGFDVALRIHFGTLPDAASLKARRLGTIDVGPHASPAYLAEHGEPRRPEDLARHRCLSMTAVGPAWSLHHARSGRAVKVEIDTAMASNDHHALRDAACEGAGIAAIPSFLSAEAVADGRLVRVLPAWSLQTATLSMLWPATRHLSPRVRAFVDVAASFFAASPLAGAGGRSRGA